MHKGQRSHSSRALGRPSRVRSFVADQERIWACDVWGCDVWGCPTSMDPGRRLGVAKAAISLLRGQPVRRSQRRTESRDDTAGRSPGVGNRRDQAWEADPRSQCALSDVGRERHQEGCDPLPNRGRKTSPRTALLNFVAVLDLRTRCVCCLDYSYRYS